MGTQKSLKNMILIESFWFLFDSTNQMVYLKKVVTCVTAKFCFGNQKESVIQLMIHSFMVNQITEWMILNWKQPNRHTWNVDPYMLMLYLSQNSHTWKNIKK